jgi:hypothetical protein
MSVAVGAKGARFHPSESGSRARHAQRVAEERACHPGVHAGGVQRHLHNRDVHVSRLRGRTEPGQRHGARVTVDTFFALKAWADAQSLKFPLLSDFNKDVIRQDGVLNPDMIGLKDISKRARSSSNRGDVVLNDARNEPNYAKVKQTLASL